ncbi:immunoglobulin superfamily member 1-like [Hemitrygon akajei]|uniref:immunoglobulin superfamily member 1-like n=1 Tax=Hemitrygon akajei TaxID=2704970 RepID=UPI003BF9AE7F
MITAVLLLLIAVVKDQSENVQADLVKPILSADRRVYVSGEANRFNCTAKSQHPISRYLLHKVGLQTPVQKPNYLRQSSITFTMVNMRAGLYDYYCAYLCSIRGRKVTSEKSETVKITVVDRPPKPQILSYPRNKVYVTGESVILTCSINYPVHSDGTFQLYKNRQPVMKEQSEQGRAHFTIRIGGDASSEYSCDYTCTASGRSLTSTDSGTMKIKVVGLLK